MLFRVGGGGGIAHSKFLTTAGSVRFAVRDEIGPVRLPGHREALVQARIQLSHAGFVACAPGAAARWRQVAIVPPLPESTSTSRDEAKST